ncbi:hypothetical protein HY085_03290 [Candidatus Gottesmanbacteria bacterium]|nr:hypothetical protein [Candidatus Gottesmanbacteria bacterium]
MKKFFIFLLFLFFFFLPLPVLAYNIDLPGCTQTVMKPDPNNPNGPPIEIPGISKDVPSLGCLAQIVSNVIGIAFLFLGAVTVLFLLWGAIRFVISRGDPKGIQEAQKTMTYAIIGAVVVLGAFILINMVTTAFGLPNILTSFTFYQP